MICIQDELGQLSLQKGCNDSTKVAISIPNAGVNDSSPETPQQAFALKQGWMDSVFGCLRPVLSIIGKAGVNEIKGNQGNLLL